MIRVIIIISNQHTDHILHIISLAGFDRLNFEHYEVPISSRKSIADQIVIRIKIDKIE